MPKKTTIAQLNALADEFNAKAQAYSKTHKSVFACAVAVAEEPTAPEKFPQRIILQGLKGKHRTLRFTPQEKADIMQIARSVLEPAMKFAFVCKDEDDACINRVWHVA